MLEIGSTAAQNQTMSFSGSYEQRFVNAAYCETGTRRAYFPLYPKTPR